ncbi:MAG: ribosome biogenesis GTP-binding protein YihA/YsxC [Marinilabiliaceae bacterium]
MKIKEATFIKSSIRPDQCPAPDKPEYAFIGRSNVGKSSLLNLLCNKKNLAKISGTPGKTRTINHFLIDESWYMVDLPGYGYAKLPQSERKKFAEMIESYLIERPNLVNLFILVDSRHGPYSSDLNFMQDMGTKGVPFSIVFTKTDKLKPGRLEQNLKDYQDRLSEDWEELPPIFLTSAESRTGQKELINYIGSINQTWMPEE